MKRIVLLLALLPLYALAQERIRFAAPHSELRSLSRVVSIDRVDKDTITAYANEAERARLQALGYTCRAVPEPEPKALAMASSVDELRQWNRYPTYATYVAFMRQMAAEHPALCRLDTIGLSVRGRLILGLRIHGTGADAPEFFYSSTIHGDELTGFYFMLRLIDTLLSGYGNDPELTALVDAVDIYINPLTNPDGTYAGGDNSVQGSMRYNANWVDLNRNYPDPFGVQAGDALQKENEAMIGFVAAHQFRLSANLHGGAEVMNYPWDSFESGERLHPQADWWKEVCRRFVDTARRYAPNHFNDVAASGFINGGDWYVISNGRQDYMNYYHNCLELTMEISTTKKLSTDRLDEYWRFQHRSLINYIKETPGINLQRISPLASSGPRIYPNPTSGRIHVEPASLQAGPVALCDLRGRELTRIAPQSATEPLEIDLSPLPSGIYILRAAGWARTIVKQ